MNFDELQVLFWSVTYILVIMFNIKYRHTALPVFALCNNFAWETMALYHDLFPLSSFEFDKTFVFHALWFLLDALIFITYICLCKRLYFKKRYAILTYAFAVILFALIFKYVKGGMLISSFVIDFTMALEFYIFSLGKNFKAKKLSSVICATKLIGDFCAWLYYMKFSTMILVIGSIILVLNTLCFVNMTKKVIKKIDL